MKVPEILVLEHAQLRAAAWPIETLDDFAAPALTRAVDALDACEAARAADKDLEIAALHAAVPLCADRAARRHLLAHKRAVFADVAPPVCAPAVAAQLAALPVAPALARAADLRRAVDEARRTLHGLHAETMALQRIALRACTCAPRFARALMLERPDLAEAWLARPPAPERARGRRVEATVMHYLLRATGRATPQGLWAGAAPVSPAEAGGLQVQPGPGGVSVHLDLAPFAAALRLLAARPRYREAASLRINPTLHATDEGWRYLAQGPDGCAWALLPRHPLRDLFIEHYLRADPGPAAPLIAAVVAAVAAPDSLAEALRRVARVLLDADVLRVDLSLPPGEDPWAVLRAAGERLLAPERGPWLEDCAHMQRLCAALAAELLRLEPLELRDRRAEIVDALASLWSRLGLPGSPLQSAAQPLRVDLRLPWTVTWDADRRARVGAALAEVFAVHAADAEAYRRAALRPWAVALGPAGAGPLLPVLVALDRARAGLIEGGTADAAAESAYVPGDSEPVPEDSPPPPGGPWTRRRIFARFPATAALTAECQAEDERWERLLAPGHAAASLRLPPAPAVAGPVLGAALLGPGEPPWFGPSRPQPALFLARLARLLADTPATANPAAAALRAALDGLGDAAPLEIVGADPASPSAALRPALTRWTLDLAAPDVPLHTLSLRLVGGRPLLEHPARGRLRPVYNSGAAIGARDPTSWRLFSLAMHHGWEFLAFEPPATPAELREWKHRPRLLSAGGVVLAPRRWLIDGERLRRLIAADELEQYVLWRREVRRLELPAIVRVAIDADAAELPLPTDSPLALRCLLGTLARRSETLILRELPGSPASWPLRDAAGHHYLAELAVVWTAPETEHA